jgi:hypothetical protein
LKSQLESETKEHQKTKETQASDSLAAETLQIGLKTQEESLNKEREEEEKEREKDREIEREKDKEKSRSKLLNMTESYENKIIDIERELSESKKLIEMLKNENKIIKKMKKMRRK